MERLIHILLLIPFLGFIINLFIPSKKERLISGAAFFTVGIQIVFFCGVFIYWMFQGFPSINIKDFMVFHTNDYEFFIDYTFDKITAVYLLVGSLLTFLVTIYSRAYLHRESGFKRFYNTILFFYLGYNIAIFSGNFETLFVGWEVLGICSFLLIAFYRDRYLPVKNALKVYTMYRISDLGLILAMWMSHHLWHKTIIFTQLHDIDLVQGHLQEHAFIGFFISLMILITASVKSAQLPFSSWLPRAMEGPTPSSAIFYGSLSVHLGVFLMLRTHPFWENQISIRILVALIGLSSSLIATAIARVQSTVKSQIAYSSIAQIGLIFIEIAAGFETLALIHFAGNAFLRTYQLLVSPSVVSYLIKEQFYNFTPRAENNSGTFSRKIQNSIYVLSLKEWNLDLLIYTVLWNPLKWIGRKMSFINFGNSIVIFIPLYLIGLYLLSNEELIPPYIESHLIPYSISLFGLLLVLKSFSERKNVFLSWILVIMNHLCVVLAISFNEHFHSENFYLYISGVSVSGLIGYICIHKLQNKVRFIDFNKFNGFAYKYPNLSFVFFLCCLGLMGFPITPTFIGEDLIYTQINHDQLAMVFFTTLSLMVDGLSMVRIYARLFLGPYEKSYHEVAYRSS